MKCGACVCVCGCERALLLLLLVVVVVEGLKGKWRGEKDSKPDARGPAAAARMKIAVELLIVIVYTAIPASLSVKSLARVATFRKGASWYRMI